MDWNLFLQASEKNDLHNITAIDVGARWGIGQRWTGLEKLVNVFGFDPDPLECERLNAISESNINYVPIALGRCSERKALYITKEPACSSLYPPNEQVSLRLPETECIRLAKMEYIDVISFDEWRLSSGAPTPTVMKLDVQGGELCVLEGAVEALKSVQLLEVEVEFNPLYDGQPLFSDIDQFLRANDFVLWNLTNKAHYSSGELHGLHMWMDELNYFDSKPVRGRRGCGQLYWAHAYFTRSELSPASPARIPVKQAIAASIVSAAYGLYDLAYLALIKSDPESNKDDLRGLLKTIMDQAHAGQQE